MFRRGRRQLLQVLHSTRALDTSLKEYLASQGIPSSGSSLGSYLYALANHSILAIAKLPKSDQQRYQLKIVDERNRYMHQAGACPASDAEIRILLSEHEPGCEPTARASSLEAEHPVPIRPC